MFRYLAFIATGLAIGASAQAGADQISPQHVSDTSALSCIWPRHCNGEDRDLLVDRLYRVTCGDAKIIVRHRGLSKVKTVACGGTRHKFKGLWKGRTYLVSVSGSTGDIVSFKPVGQ